MEHTLALIERSHQGDKEARDTIFKENAGLIYSVAKRFLGRGVDMEDLFQIGSIGLLKAVDHFDTSFEVRFSTYAVPMIIGEIRRYLRDYNPIRVSRSMRDTAYKALQAREMLTNKNNKEPTLEEIAKEIDMPKENVVFALEAIQDPISLFEPVYHDGTDVLYVMDQVKDDKNTDTGWIDNISLKEAISKLNDREKNIINLRFFKGKTQMEVSEEIGISQAQVSRLEKNALKTMRKYV